MAVPTALLTRAYPWCNAPGNILEPGRRDNSIGVLFPSASKLLSPQVRECIQPCARVNWAIGYDARCYLRARNFEWIAFRLTACVDDTCVQETAIVPRTLAKRETCFQSPPTRNTPPVS